MADRPVNTIDRVDDTHYVVKNCVICGDTHRHGAVDDLDVGETTTRGAHCSGTSEEYTLKFTEHTTDERTN